MEKTSFSSKTMKEVHLIDVNEKKLTPSLIRLLERTRELVSHNMYLVHKLKDVPYRLTGNIEDGCSEECGKILIREDFCSQMYEQLNTLSEMNSELESIVEELSNII